MEIIINDNSKLCEIQEEFNKHFSYLKLEFFGYEQEEKNVFAKKNLIINTKQRLGDIRHIHRSGQVSINGHLKVSTLEENFRNIYGINVQVFRKSGDNWLVTSVTDDWTLSQQNRKGAETVNLRREEVKPNFDYYHEQQ